MLFGKIGFNAMAFAVAAFGLAACGGGGGGGPATTVTTPPPVTTPTTPTNSTAKAPGFLRWTGGSRQPGSGAGAVGGGEIFSFTTDAGGMLVTRVTGLDIDVQDTTDATGALAKIYIGPRGAGEALDLRVSNGASVVQTTEQFATLQSADGSQIITAPTAALQPTLNYHSFGYWETGRGRSAGTLGVVATGAMTSENGIRTAGKQYFTGQAVGDYVMANGGEIPFNADVTVLVDFDARSADFTTRNTRDIRTQAAIGPLLNTNLDLTGKLTISPGQNVVTGVVYTPDIHLIGGLLGHFYGPTGQELGGTFSLNGQNGSRERLIGAFGTRGE